MKIVIEIQEDKYKRIVEKYDTFPVEMKEWGLDAIKNGTPLPKDHGRLIDAKDVGEYLTLADVPTIIEADKESEV